MFEKVLFLCLSWFLWFHVRFKKLWLKIIIWLIYVLPLIFGSDYTFAGFDEKNLQLLIIVDGFYRIVFLFELVLFAENWIVLSTICKKISFV